MTTQLRRTKSAAVAGLCVLALGLAACSGSGTTAEEGKPLPTVTGNPAVTLDVFAPQGAETNLATNEFTKKMNQKFNITFKWQVTTFDAGPAKEKRQISLASGDYPDLYMLIPWVEQFTPTELLKLGSQGVVVPLNQLIDQYAPNIKKALDAEPEWKAMATAPDGKIYGMPQFVDCYHCTYQGKLWMNTAWLKKLGLEQPKTTEDMVKVLRAFKTQDPNGNGKADEIPLTGSVRSLLIPYFMNAFIYDPQGASGYNNSTLVLNDGKVDVQANKDGWREGLKYLNSLYKEGLIDKGAFTQNPDALTQQGDGGKVPMLGAATVLHLGEALSIGAADGRDKQYDAVPPLTGPQGVNHTGYNFPSAPGATFVLTNKATQEEQIQAIKLLDYIFTDEGQINGQFGSEGKAWTKPQPGDVALDKSLKPTFKQIPQKPGATPLNSGWGAMAQYNNTEKFRNSEAIATDIYSQAGFERRLFEATKLYEGKEDKALIYPFWKVWIDPSLATEVATLQTNLDNYVQQNSLQFITGSKNLDTEWDAYVKGLEGLGLKRFLEIQQTAYDKIPK
ncbi:putative aldouronate transport system substrate-binding protein [Kribbella sp. VKM Ac-2527]|uniref:Putative aldouronate transport system substrate-binding protein n=1 Tax=Kribbella caucasensis TaxID=2512215 RepID=A0A4R6KCW3_9ACTN|nr:extracellular solute-binding protein [Kribbella sp. VKM Ac-2527]TDO46702.1 putative aldouronate transport system substrate-binding protein [Kribbella sp. VKM Ac-2527]